MKLLSVKIGLRLVVFPLAWLLCQSASAAVGFTVTPSAVSNTYAGTITIQVTGLASGDTVTVQKYKDVNRDGVVDAGDLLWQQFNLTDGSSFVIGGVTNIGVPGDTDTTAGQITAKLSFQVDFSQTIAGNYLFVLSSPASHFAALTKPFAVTNFPFAQKFTGTVVNGGAPVPNASVILFQFTGGNNINPIGGTTADSSGVYSIPAAPGIYTPVPFAPNFLANFQTLPTLTLSNNATITTNLGLTPATETISGIFEDANNATIRLPGLLVPAQTQGAGLLGICFTDPNGNFSVGVNSNQWKIGGDGNGLALLGYVGLENKTIVDARAGSVPGVTLSFPKATALFYGTVKDNLGNPLPGVVAVEAYDLDDNIYQSDGYTDANGNYAVGVIGSLGNGDPWWVNIDNSSSYPNYIFSEPKFDDNGGTNIAAGQAVPANFTAILATNTISGNVKFNGANVAGVGVAANATIGGVTYYINSVDTDENGNYSFNVANGTWDVFVDCQGGGDSLDGVLGVGNYQCPNSQMAIIADNSTQVNITVPPPGTGAFQISGNVVNNTFSPVVGVMVHANNGVGANLTTTTDGGGNYSFSVGDGSWDVSVDCVGLGALGYQCAGDQQVNINNNNDNGVNFMVQPCGSLGVSTPSQLPDAFVGGFFAIQLQNSGCNSPFTWSYTPGSLHLPSGLTLSNNGAIYGTPGAPGTYYFSVRVTDGMANTADQLLQLNVYEPMQMTPGGPSLPSGTIGAFYSTQILVSGGNPILLSGKPDGYYSFYNPGLPPGLNFTYGAITSSNEYFVISGTPTNSGTFTFTMGAGDADGNTVSNSYSITIMASSLQITTASLNNAVEGVEYDDQLQASGGQPPYTWSIALGSQPLPTPLAISPGGLISGIPGTNGTFSFIVRITDSHAVTVTHPFSLVIKPPATQPNLSAPAWLANHFQMLLNGAAGQNYTVQMSTNLGTPNWLTLFITNNAVSGSFLLTDTNATNKARYYRILVGP